MTDRFIYDVPVRWSDMDAYGHVNNARFLTLYEEARVAMFFVGARAHGLGSFEEGIVIARHEIDYLRPVDFGDPVRIEMWISELRAAASTHLHTLMLRTGLTVHLAVLDEGRIHYLDKIGARFATSVPSRVGGYAPAHCTALGKAMLAWLSPEDVDERVGEDLRAMTGHSVADSRALHHELHRVRGRHGIALERGECFEDIACVAAAIHAPEGPIGAISLVGDSATPLERVAPLVLDAARQVSLELFPDAGSRRGRTLHSI